MSVSQEFVNSIGFAAAVTLVMAILPPTSSYAPWVGAAFLIILALRYQRTGGQ